MSDALPRLLAVTALPEGRHRRRLWRVRQPDDSQAGHGFNLSGVKRWLHEHVVRHRMKGNVVRIRAGQW